MSGSASIGSRYYTPSAFDVNAAGVPYAGGQLYFYASGTNTPLQTFSDVALQFPNPNPVVADSSGHFPSIFLFQNQPYKVTFCDANNVQVWSYDPVGPAAGNYLQQQNTSGIIGEVRLFAGLAAAVPSQWYLCYGQAVSRTTYATAFNVLGTQFGGGDGVTNFNLPDLRGRVAAGIDNMGGIGANRLTSGISGVPGTVLGGSGGDQNAQNPTLTVSSSVADPGHFHVESVPSQQRLVYSSSANFYQGGGFDAGAQNIQTEVAETGITVSVNVSTDLIGESQNVQPTICLNYIIFLGA